jgi:hypothetical protein
MALVRMADAGYSTTVARDDSGARQSPQRQYSQRRCQQALAEIGHKLRRVQEAHGGDAVGVYLGNPVAHNFGNAQPLLLS